MALTEKQKLVLAKFGYDTAKISDSEGKKIVDAIAENGWKPLPGGPPRAADTNSPATPKQKACLRKFGYNDDVSFAAANAIIDDLAANNWERPDDADELAG